MFLIWQKEMTVRSLDDIILETSVDSMMDRRLFFETGKSIQKRI